MRRGFFCNLIAMVARLLMFFWHPVFRVTGRENVPKEGRLMICANHVGMADPIWLIFALKLGHIPRIMAKKEAMQIPIVGWVLKQFGVFGVDREAADINAIKTGLRCLNDEQQLIIFPEGTRVKEGTHVEPKRGAVTLAARTDTPILPAYLSRRRPFGPVVCVLGEPYKMQFAGKRATDEELKQEAENLMRKIYQLGADV